MSDTHRGTKRQAPTVSSNHSEHNDNLSQDDILSLPGTNVFDETLSQVSRGKRRRKRFGVDRRKEVAKVRKIGACDECRARKVACKHALQGSDNPDSAPTPKPSPQPYPFDFESVYPTPTYPKAILEDGGGQVLQLDRPQLRDQSFDEGSDLIATVKGYVGRQARLADAIHDFDNVIGDNSRHSAVKCNTNSSEWGQASPFMVNAMALMNNQQSSQPSTEYLHSNLSTNLRLSSPTSVSSHPDLLSPGTKPMTFCQCSTNPCGHSYKVEHEEFLGRYYEVEHAKPRSSNRAYFCPEACGIDSFRKPESLHTHIKLQHPNISSSPTQLLPSGVSKLDAQPDKLAHVHKYLAEEYVPGIEENPIAVTDRQASQMMDRFSAENLDPLHLSDRAQNLRRSSSPMPSQLSDGVVGGTTNVFEHQVGNVSSVVENTFITPSLYTSRQQAPYRNRRTVNEMYNSNEQYRKRHSHPQFAHSPTLSWTGQFPRAIHNLDQIDIYQASSGIGATALDAGMQSNNHGTLLMADNMSLDDFQNLGSNWNSSASGFSPHTLTPYDNSGYSQTEVNFQPGNVGSSMGLPSWLERESSLAMIGVGGVNNGYAPPGLQLDSHSSGFLLDDTSLSANYHVSPDTTKTPMIMLNNQMLYGDQDPSVNFTLDPLTSDPVLSQRHSVPYLEHGTLSSSGASESLVSPIDAANPFVNKGGEDWDVASTFYNDFSNMDVNTNDETNC